MTKKDFELIAEVILHADFDYKSYREMIARRLANRFRDKFPRFNKRRFLIACGVDPW